MACGRGGGFELAVSEAVGAWTPLTELTHAVFAQADEAGHGIHSGSGVARVYEARTGVRLVGGGPSGGAA